MCHVMSCHVITCDLTRPCKEGRRAGGRTRHGFEVLQERSEASVQQQTMKASEDRTGFGLMQIHFGEMPAKQKGKFGLV